MNYKKISPSVFAKASDDMLAVVMTKDKIKLSKKVKKIYDLPFISSIAIKGRFDDIADLSNDPNVCSIASVEEFSIESELEKSSVKTFSTPRFFDEVEPYYAVCILDSGVSCHLDLCSIKNRLVERVSVIGNSVFDENGHGTMIAGLIAGNGFMSKGEHVGVYQNAKIVSVKCMRSDGRGDSLDILKGMQWIYDNAWRYKIKVVSMAFGAPYQGAFDPLVKGVFSLYKKGLIVVSASGNSPLEGVRSPGVSEYCLTVGAYDRSGKECRRADFSARDEFIKKPEILLPGVNVCAIEKDGGYSVYSGTSVSCGLAAGVACFLSQKVRGLSLQKLKGILLAKSPEKDRFEVAIAYP